MRFLFQFVLMLMTMFFILCVAMIALGVYNTDNKVKWILAQYAMLLGCIGLLSMVLMAGM